MKSAKTIAIVAAVLFAALSPSAPSAERDDAAPARAPVRTPTRVVRTRTRPTQTLEEEAPIPRPAARTPSRRPPSRPTTTRPPSRRVRPPEDPHKDTVILVESFMVQARLSALYSLDVPQISRECKSVTAEHIQKLLKSTDAAVVTAGAKLALVHENKAKTDTTARQALYFGPPEKRKVEYVDVGTSFTAIAEIRREGKIFVELEFEHSAIEKGDDEDDIGTLVERQWSSGVYLEAGEPALVGATQNKETATFLIVTASIKK